MKILALVASISGENPERRKGQGFWATLVVPELAGPKLYRIRESKRETR